jgi:hypothetical protein
MSGSTRRRFVVGALCLLPTLPGGSAPTGPLRSVSAQETAADGGLECPAAIDDPQGLSVPVLPEGLDGNARLLPDREPTALVVCSYPVLDAFGATPLAPPYAVRSRTVADATVRAGIVEALTWAPRGRPEGKVCTAMGGNETVHLVGATYEDAIVWVAAKADPNSCSGATNGDFTSRAAVGVVVEGLLAAREPPALATGGCDTRTLGRLGDDRSLAPEGAPQVTVCRVTRSGEPRATPLGAGQSQQVLEALRRLTVRPTNGTCEGAKADPSGHFRLVLAYAAGPDAVVNVVPGCVPPVLGLGVEADDADAIVDVVEQWSKPIPGPDPDTPVSSDAATS